MRGRIRRLVLGVALAVCVLPGGAAGAQESVAPSGTGKAAETQVPEATGAATPEPPRRGGLIGAVLDWLRGDEDEEPSPAPGSALAAVPEPASAGALEPETGPQAQAEPEALAALAPLAGSESGAAPKPGTRRAQEVRLAPAAGATTLAEVYRAAHVLVAEIEVLRRAQGITGASAPTAPASATPAPAAPAPAASTSAASAPTAPTPAAPGTGHEVPIHAWLESLEVMEKAARVQRRFGMIPFEPSTMPAGDVTLADTHRNVLTVVEELRRVKRQLVIETRIESAPSDPDATPAHLHARLAGASALLDGLVGRPVSSNDVYMHLKRVRAGVAPLAAHVGVALEPDPPGEEGAREAKAPRDAARQVLIAIYKAVNLQSRLGMAPSDVPEAPAGEVAPAEVYEAVNRLLVELARIRAHLGVEAPGPKREETRRMQSADVVAQAQRLIAELDRVSRAVAGSG